MYCFQKFKSAIVLNKYITKIIIHKTYLNNFYTYYLTFAKVYIYIYIRKNKYKFVLHLPDFGF